MAGSTSNLDLISSSQAQKEVTANALFDAASSSLTFGRRASTCAALTWGYYGGTFPASAGLIQIANGTLALTANATNYIEVDADGVISANTTDFTLGRLALYEVITGAATVSSYTDWRSYVSPVGLVYSTTQCLPVACGDETTALTTGTKVTFRMPFAFTLSAVRASVTTAPTGTTLLTVDINEGGTSILSTKLTFDAGQKTTTTATTAAVISDTSLADDAEITIDIDSVGSTVAGAGLKVYLIGAES